MILALEDYNFGENRYQVAVLAIELAMDHKPSHREMTSLLLSDLYQRFLTEREMEKGTHILTYKMNKLFLLFIFLCYLVHSLRKSRFSHVLLSYYFFKIILFLN